MHRWLVVGASAALGALAIASCGGEEFTEKPGAGGQAGTPGTGGTSVGDASVGGAPGSGGTSVGGAAGSQGGAGGTGGKGGASGKGGSEATGGTSGAGGSGTICEGPAPTCCTFEGTVTRADCRPKGWICPPGSFWPDLNGQCPERDQCSVYWPCEDTEWCDYPTNKCGNEGAIGTCRLRPLGCESREALVCACDGALKTSACEASVAGLDVSLNGCELEPGSPLFPCGFHYCDKTTEYCQLTPYLDPALPEAAMCMPFPDACFLDAGTPSCNCVRFAGCQPRTCEVDTVFESIVVTCTGEQG